jgi:hypothetical protein
MAERILPAYHECALVEVNTAVGIWRCACGRAYWLPADNHARAPEWDDRPLTIDGHG